jgi:hypothetical protein
VVPIGQPIILGSGLTVHPPDPQRRYPLPRGISIVKSPERSNELLDSQDTDDAMHLSPRLEWTWQLSQTKLSDPIGGCLSDFVLIEPGNHASVHAFAQRRGPIGFCEQHWLPATHAPECRPPGAPPRGHLGATKAVCWEPTAKWFRLVRQARAVLNIAEQLSRGDRPREADWGELHGGYLGTTLAERPEEPLPILGAEVAGVVSTWLKWADVVPRMIWGGQEAAFQCVLEPAVPSLGESPPGFVFQLLALQLAAALTSPKGLYSCSECGMPFNPLKRRVRSDREAYCPSCTSIDSEGRPKSKAAKRRWWRKRATSNRNVAADVATEADDSSK